jgi:hypothetical protein
VKVLQRVATQAVTLAAIPAAIQVEVPCRVATQAVTLAVIRIGVQALHQQHALVTALQLVLVHQMESIANVALANAIQILIHVLGMVDNVISPS